MASWPRSEQNILKVVAHITVFVPYESPTVQRARVSLCFAPSPQPQVAPARRSTATSRRREQCRSSDFDPTTIPITIATHTRHTIVCAWYRSAEPVASGRRECMRSRWGVGSVELSSHVTCRPGGHRTGSDETQPVRLAPFMAPPRFVRGSEPHRRASLTYAGRGRL